MKYMFITENGTFDIEYEDYLKNQDLMDAIGDARRRFLNLGRVIVSYPVEWLMSHPSKQRDFDLLAAEQLANPLRFYMPCCARSGFGSPAHRFINDNRHSACIMRAGNRFGKSVAAWIKQMVSRGLIPCDPKWEVFQENGVKYIPWTGPKKMGIGTYQWENHRRAIWPGVVQAWTPAEELGDYRKGGNKTLSFQTGPVIKLACGSEIQMNAYDQDQNVFESDAKDGWMWDEQAQEAKFDGANMRCATRRWWYKQDGLEYLGGGWHDFSMTPHAMEDRKDTGSETFVHDMEEGIDLKGLTIASYQGSVLDDTPDWVYREREKLAQKKTWIDDPWKSGDMKRYREGRARMYGEYHVSTGLVYDDFDESVHVVDDFPLKMDWTRYRGIDHGKKHPFVSVSAAVTEEGDVIIYDIYTAMNKNVSENIATLVARAGNKLVTSGKAVVLAGDTPQTFIRKREVMCGTRFRITCLDGRSFKKPQDNMSITLGELYALHGLVCTPASGLNNSTAIPIVAEYFRIRPTVKHRVTGNLGAPRVYIFRSCIPLIRAIKRYRYAAKEGSVKEKIAEGKDDEMDAMKYLMQLPLKYIPGYSSALENSEMEQKPKRKVVRDVYSGW
jgi:hypothetical protein